ncbi:hypothetical protein GE09DRAFT_1060932 [Coniochaeta sp. 2T2.1]|nr:hypothetical protein GE09DRAFT_1060932 [Coniochaeta sp. 2T2.1]
MPGSRTAPTNPKTDPNQENTKEKTADEKPNQPLAGCVVNYAGFFGHKYPRTKLREMFKELGAKECFMYNSPDITHVITSKAAYNNCTIDVARGEECGAHILSVEWLKDCYALRQRMDEEDYYFDEPPKEMLAYHFGMGKWVTRPYQHLVEEEEEDDLEVLEDETGEEKEALDVEETEQLGSQATEVDKNGTLEE